MRSLTLNLFDSVHKPPLLRLRTADLYALFALHHERRVQFRARIAEPPFVTDAVTHSLLIPPLHGAQSVVNRYRTWSGTSCGLWCLLSSSAALPGTPY